jgi:hypothetical protein
MNHLEFEEKAELGRMVGLKFHTTSREGWIKRYGDPYR